MNATFAALEALGNEPPMHLHRDDDDAPSALPEHGVTLEDFYAYMPTHQFLFTPSREMWPASSVDARIAPIILVDGAGQPLKDDKGKVKTVKASTYLDQTRAVEQLTWAPGEPMLIENKLIADGGWFDRPGCSVINLYRPPVIALGDPDKAGPWLDHVEKVFPADAEHIVKWLAHRVQRPHEKCNHALVMMGFQGTGKDTIIEGVIPAIGSWNMADVSPDQFLARFNGFIKSVILRVSEARDLGDHDRFRLYDHLKTIIAAPPDLLRCDEKHLREVSVPNLCGVVITTNHGDGIYLPADDRRHFVARTDLTKDDFTPDYFSRLYGWYENDGGYAHIAALLHDVDLSKFDPKAPPRKTDAFWAVVDCGRAPEDAELQDALDRLGNPTATTLALIASVANNPFADWLRDRGNSRKIPHRLEACDYVQVRNSAVKDGLWIMGGKRQVIYARRELTIRNRIAAAQQLVEDARL